ncbi:hypothetical protein BHE74_00002179 [Ensete ventricosum]|nr:hypothetical protein GW17_00041915 [Ensete ventricosum]RWW88927.1 hypothetical protein BHE74_00002179 [Ensete ventricosum]
MNPVGVETDGGRRRGSAASKHSTTWPAIALKGRYQASTLFSCLWGSVTDKLISGTLSDVEFKWVSAFLPKAARPVSVLYHHDHVLKRSCRDSSSVYVAMAELGCDELVEHPPVRCLLRCMMNDTLGVVAGGEDMELLTRVDHQVFLRDDRERKVGALQLGQLEERIKLWQVVVVVALLQLRLAGEEWVVVVVVVRHLRRGSYLLRGVELRREGHMMVVPACRVVLTPSSDDRCYPLDENPTHNPSLFLKRGNN